MILIVLFILAQGIWLETTQADFADGLHEANIYVSMHNGGTIEFTSRWDLDCDGYVDIVIANQQTNTSYIYWGSPSGYNSANYTSYPVDGAQNCDAADINFDGFPELFLADPSTGMDNIVRMFWGTDSGPNPNNYVNIQLYDWNECCYIADFNKDGYLDLAVSIYKTDSAAVFYGDSNGISDSTNTFPSHDGWNNIEVADFDWDGWLDIVIINGNASDCYIYYGDAIGYHSQRSDTLLRPPGLPGGPSVADFNRDRYLDVVLPGWSGGNETYIYLGNSAGFSIWDTLSPGAAFGGSSVADFNEDGFLDLLFLLGYGFTQRPVIYWGSTNGFDDANTTEIGFDVDGSGSLVYDFNNDGTLDILVNNFAWPAEDSYILLGPNYVTPLVFLPTGRDDHSRFREIGSVYDRRYREHYISSVFDAGDTVDWGIVEWLDSLPTGTTIDMRVRSGNTPSHDTTWSTWFLANNGDSIPDSFNSRFIQYMAVLRYTNPAYLPCLYEVRISYDTLTGIYTSNEPCFQIPVRISPNPFVTNTKITYNVSEPKSAVTIRIYDVTGRIIKTLIDQKHGSGSYDIMWSGDDDGNRPLPEGIYYLTFESDNKTDNITSFKIIHIKE